MNLRGSYSACVAASLPESPAESSERAGGRGGGGAMWGKGGGMAG